MPEIKSDLRKTIFSTVDFNQFLKTLHVNDGSAPCVVMNFGNKKIVEQAYASIQSLSTCFPSIQPHYWSLIEEKDCPINFGTNPAEQFLRGEIEGFHVVFSGVVAPNGTTVPDLGVHVLETSKIEIDYRMGPEWDEKTVFGFFSILEHVSQLADKVTFTCEANQHDPNGELFLKWYSIWKRCHS
jgi:hypothetical protein